MAGELSFLEVNGVEVANAARTIRYMQRGLQPRVELGREGYCATLATELGSGGVSPAVDPAPWYTPLAPSSVDFLGLLILDMPVNARATRVAVSRLGGRGGAAIGAQEDDAEIMDVHGWLIARSAGGLAYGKRWLAAQLTADPCNPCALAAVRYHEYCGDGSEWILHDAGLTADGIVWGDGDPDGAWLDVAFQLTSSHAARFRRPVLIQPATRLAADPGVDGGDWTTFATDPFAGSAPLLACSPANASGLACGGTVSGGAFHSGGLGASRSTFYRVGREMFDGAVVVKWHTDNPAGSGTFGLAARWRDADTADSKAIVLRVDPDGVGGIKISCEESLVQSGLFGRTSFAAGFTGYSTSFAHQILTDYWLRLHVDGDVMIGQLWDVDPYDGTDVLRSDVGPLRETPWPPDPAQAGHAMTSAAASEPGTWGIVWFAESDVDQTLDDLRFVPECMSFTRWFCEAPPLAATSIELAPTEPGGTVAAIVTLDATAGQIANAYIEARRGTCDAAGDVFARINVPLVAAGGVLVIDSARGRVDFTAADGTLLDGTALLELAEGKAIEWIEAPECDAPICVSAGVSAWCGTSENATITIERQERVR